MKIIIIEDEKPAARYLQRKIEALGFSVQKVIDSVELGIKWFENNLPPDLIFADIQLADGLSFEIFEKLSVQSPIIFTTAYDSFALKAFKLNSIDYLLKPIDEQELATALNKFNSVFDPYKLDINQLKKILIPANKERYTVKIGNQIKIFDKEQIECFYSFNKSSYLFTVDGRSYPLDETLDTIENEFDEKCFFRVNRQFIVNIKAIKNIHIYLGTRLKLSLLVFDAEDIIVSREKVANFKKWLN